jgi:hypothetical protein
VNYIKDLHDYNMDEPEEVKEFFGVNAIDRLKDIVNELIDNEQSRLVEYATDVISEAAAYRAKRFLEKVLKGDENAFQELLSGDSSRYRSKGVDVDKTEPWASVIHGSIYLTSGMKIREAIVDAHADRLKDERIKDLESIVEGLRKQIVHLENQLLR